MLLDFTTLFEPYTKDNCTVEMLIGWLVASGKKEGFYYDVIDSAMTETFLEIKNGRSFLGKCDCGCDNNDVHNWLSHHILGRCREIHQEVEEKKRLVLQENLNTQILAHIHDQNEAYVAEVCPDGPPKPKEAEAKWQELLVKKEKELQKRELILLVRESKINAKTSAIFRKQAEGRTRTPRWKIWKRSKP